MPPSCYWRKLWTFPNAITAIRPVCVGPFLWLCAIVDTSSGSWARVAVLVLLGVIIASDLTDGWLARRLNQDTRFGRWFDHGSDVGFILVTLVFFVTHNLAPWWLPVAIAGSFGLYVIRSGWLGVPPSTSTLARCQLGYLSSRLGHIGGVLYFSCVGLLTVEWCTPGWLISPARMRFFFTVLALVAVASGLEHLVRLWSHDRDSVPGEQMAKKPIQ